MKHAKITAGKTVAIRHSAIDETAMNGRVVNKAETTLAELDPNEPIDILPAGRPVIKTTARELMHQARLPGFLTIEQVEFAFSA